MKTAKIKMTVQQVVIMMKVKDLPRVPVSTTGLITCKWKQEIVRGQVYHTGPIRTVIKKPETQKELQNSSYTENNRTQ